jgi:hypothetical protein
LSVSTQLSADLIRISSFARMRLSAKAELRKVLTYSNDRVYSI